METFFRKRKAEQIPDNDSFYFVKTINKIDLIHCHYNKEIDEWHSGSTIYIKEEIYYWLEEVELPSDIKIQEQMESVSRKQGYDDNEDAAFITGSEWMRDFY